MFLASSNFRTANDAPEELSCIEFHEGNKIPESQKFVAVPAPVY